MKLIIEIPNNDYEYIKLLQEGLTDYQTTLKIYRAVKNGEAYEERPRGEWLPNYTSQFCNPGRQCSLCGKVVEFSENFCPNCGSRME